MEWHHDIIVAYPNADFIVWICTIAIEQTTIVIKGMGFLVIFTELHIVLRKKHELDSIKPHKYP